MPGENVKNKVEKKIKIKDIPDIRSTANFYNQKKYVQPLNKVFSESILTNINYSYNAEEDT